MFFLLLVIFVLVPVIELNVLISVGESLGSWTTVGLVFFTAIVGVSLVRSQGISTLMQVQQKLSRGEAPGQEIVEGMMLAVAGLLLLIPGFVTDFIGLILLTPFTRIPVAGLLYKRMQVKVAANGGFQAGFGPGGPQAGNNPFDQSSFGDSNAAHHKNPEGGDTFDGDYEHKSDPSNKRLDSHQVDDKEDPKN
ncbi:FxsA family protein [Shewanella eurypsychrophilus]|uniref:FxsA family protein n=1 Tax=Shewanella eurypsychrophilus TaxID=2593656 RepID=A0ABX6V4Q9_9GAMM|nr:MULTISPECIES: FxsA family protein [Shewanella]QFU21257.1 FxsA family protein [Shewanella sp. YLB-09]QPG56548.1 FxsA family protein [Shewanella eurypsychrophilus]